VTKQARARLLVAAGALAVAAALAPSTSAASSDAQAIAVVERWIADVEADADRAETALSSSDLWIIANACGKGPRCAQRAFDAARLSTGLPAVTTSLHVVAPELYRYVLVGPFARYRNGHDHLIWVAWQARFERATSGYEQADVVMGLDLRHAATPYIAAAIIHRTPWPTARRRPRR
jgi:hypothetical protein